MIALDRVGWVNPQLPLGAKLMVERPADGLFFVNPDLIGPDEQFAFALGGQLFQVRLIVHEHLPSDSTASEPPRILYLSMTMA